MNLCQLIKMSIHDTQKWNQCRYGFCAMVFSFLFFHQSLVKMKRSIYTTNAVFYFFSIYSNRKIELKISFNAKLKYCQKYESIMQGD